MFVGVVFISILIEVSKYTNENYGKFLYIYTANLRNYSLVSFINWIKVVKIVSTKNLG